MLRMRIERQRRGWSQTRLSALTGIAQSDLSAMETERRAPCAGWRRRLTEVFGLSADVLFARDAEVEAAVATELAGSAEAQR